MVTLEPNMPFDPEKIRALVQDEADLKLIYPDARLPFDAAQWSERFSDRQANWSFLARKGGRIIGHIALMRIDRLQAVATLGFVYLRPEWRGQGIAREMITEAEILVGEMLHLKELRLNVRDHNEPAMHTYRKLGFTEYAREADTVRMRKVPTELAL